MSAPLYQIVIDSIVGRIASGVLLPGAMLPSEPQLGAELGVSQGTARKALMELEARGLVRRRQGKGTFVTVRTPETSLFNFFRLRNPDGSLQTPVMEHETVRKRPACKEEAQRLFGHPAEVIEIERVRSLAGVRSTHELLVVPAKLFPGLVERAPFPNAIYILYQQAFSIIIMRAEEQIRVTSASTGTASALGIGPGTPMLEIRRQAIDFLDRVVEMRTIRCLTDRHDYFVTLAQPGCD